MELFTVALGTRLAIFCFRTSVLLRTESETSTMALGHSGSHRRSFTVGGNFDWPANIYPLFGKLRCHLWFFRGRSRPASMFLFGGSGSAPGRCAERSSGNAFRGTSQDSTPKNVDNSSERARFLSAREGSNLLHFGLRVIGIDHLQNLLSQTDRCHYRELAGRRSIPSI